MKKRRTGNIDMSVVFSVNIWAGTSTTLMQ